LSIKRVIKKKIAMGRTRGNEEGVTLVEHDEGDGGG